MTTHNSLPKVLAIVGPTAVGKTSLSIQLASKYNGEIISGDSLQVYRGLDIGTAKVTKDEMGDIPHYLIDIRDIDGTYSAADFQQEGRSLISSITECGKLPIIVGGTGLYIQSLLYDYTLGKNDEEFSNELRDELELFHQEFGRQKLWELLQEEDPIAASSIHPNNVKRVIRAIEVKRLTGESLINTQSTPPRLYDHKLLGLTMPRNELYDRINERVDSMIDCGLIEEAKQLSLNRSNQSAQGIGYKELFPYFDGVCSLEDATNAIKQNSRRYAKRQLTWFRNRMDVEWWDIVSYPNNINLIEQEIATWLKE